MSDDYDTRSPRCLAEMVRQAEDKIADFVRFARIATDSIERLTNAITEAEAILRGSFRKSAKEVNAAAAEARRVLSEAIGKPTAKNPRCRMPKNSGGGLSTGEAET